MDTSKTPGLPVLCSFSRAHLAATVAAAACVLLTLLTTTTHAADDSYWRWAVAHFGHAIATGPSLEPFTFTSQSSVKTGGTARSNSIALSGFTGTLTIAATAGVTLFVNGVAQTGATGVVKAGDTLWMQAPAANTAGLVSNFTLTDKRTCSVG